MPDLLVRNTACPTKRNRAKGSEWMTFYTKVLSKYAKENGLILNATFELRPDGGWSDQQIVELRAALRELGLDDDVHAK